LFNSFHFTPVHQRRQIAGDSADATSAASRDGHSTEHAVRTQKTAHRAMSRRGHREHLLPFRLRGSIECRVRAGRRAQPQVDVLVERQSDSHHRDLLGGPCGGRCPCPSSAYFRRRRRFVKRPEDFFELGEVPRPTARSRPSKGGRIAVFALRAGVDYSRSSLSGGAIAASGERRCHHARRQREPRHHSISSDSVHGCISIRITR